MAMMISKFHRMIQNKITWWIILVVIIFSFVIWGSSVRTGNERAARDTAVGKLDGKPIQNDEYRRARVFTELGVVLMSGRDINVTPDMEEPLRRAAWQRIATLREAARLGITASNEELPMMLNQISIFRTREGQFNPEAYQGFTTQFLPRRFGMSKHGFDEFLREELVINKTAGIVGRLLTVAPYDARRTFQAMNDRFVLDYAILKPELVTNKVKVGSAEARALFDRDPASFRIPDLMRVKYVALPVSNYLAQVEVKEEDIQRFYNENLDRFVKPQTQDVASATNAFSTAATQYRSLDEVRTNIVTSLRESAAAQLAYSNAVAFADALHGDADGKLPAFADLAKAKGLTIHTTKPFPESGEVPDLLVGPEFNRAAFSLDSEPETSFSEPVEGLDAFYILSYLDKTPARIPTYEEVADRVLPVARAQAVSDELTALAKRTRDAMEKAARAKTSVTAAAAQQGVTLVTTPAFSASTAQETNIEELTPLLRSVLPHNAGEVTEIVPTETGLLIAHVKERQIADAATFESIRPQIASSLRRQQARTVFESWQAQLISGGRFEDLARRDTEEKPDAGT